MSLWSGLYFLGGTKTFVYKPIRDPAFLARVQANEDAQAAFESEQARKHPPSLAQERWWERWHANYAEQVAEEQRKLQVAMGKEREGR